MLVGMFEGEFVEGLPSGEGTWKMKALPGDDTTREGERIEVSGRWKGLMPARADGDAEEDSTFTEKRLAAVSNAQQLCS